jgi:hypothetical protein
MSHGSEGLSGYECLEYVAQLGFRNSKLPENANVRGDTVFQLLLSVDDLGVKFSDSQVRVVAEHGQRFMKIIMNLLLSHDDGGGGKQMVPSGSQGAAHLVKYANLVRVQ